MEQENIKVLERVISKQIFSLFGNRTDGSQKALDAVYCLLGDQIIFNIPSNFISDSLFQETFHVSEIHGALSSLNEKELRRKKDGVYYTLSDVTDFITYNSFLKFVDRDFYGVSSTSDISKSILSLSNAAKDRLLYSSIFDPTCGAGEFLISAIQLKIQLLQNSVDDNAVILIAKSINGNDISNDSIIISKIRVFFSLCPYIKDINRLKELAESINSNFTAVDFVNVDYSRFGRYDIVIGNPPYVEYRSLDFKPKELLGNTYANILCNVCRMISDNGVIGFIIPISYVATKRMATVRETISDSFTNICVLNYADRPDCLFAGVHQKLTILICSKISNHKGLFSSCYNYWYKQERKELFERTSLVNVTPVESLCIPKLGNNTELSIYSKCFANVFDNNILDSSSYTTPTQNNSVYLNMRNCFWIKAFSHNPGSGEYKRFSFDQSQIDFVRCLLNSSLFFFFWIAVSDCWHITSKELKLFKLPSHISDPEIFRSLFEELELKLEKTKVFVGTKQTEFEYKHRNCKDVIDKIDDAIAPLYGLSGSECNYIKNFILKYRLSDGT